MYICIVVLVMNYWVLLLMYQYISSINGEDDFTS